MYFTMIWEQGGSGAEPPIFFFGDFLCSFLAVFCSCFWHIVFADDFLISVKELGLLTNPGQWISGLDSVGFYIYCIVNNEGRLWIEDYRCDSKQVVGFLGLGFKGKISM
jgi:hypothetical protein